MGHFDADLVRSSTETLVLSVLADEPKYGYSILKSLRERSAGSLKLSAGTLYPILHKLELQGAVRSYWKTGTTRQRKYYALRAKGRQTLQDKAQEWRRFAGLVERILRPALAAI